MISGHPLLRCPFLISKSYIYFNASYACNGIKKKAELKYFVRQIDLKNLTYPYGSSINGSESNYDCCDLSHNAQCSSMWIKLHDHFWLFHQWLKKLTVFERLFLQLGTRFSGKINCCCSKVAVIERFDKNQSMDCPLWQRKVTGVKRWPLVEVQLYLFWQQIAAIVFPLLLSWLWLNLWNQTCVEEKRQNCGVYITQKAMAVFFPLWWSILGDPGADSGCEGKSKRAEKYGTKKKSKEQRVEPLRTMSYQTSSKRSPRSWLLISELKIETFSGRRQLQLDVTSSIVGYYACSRSPPCRRGPVGDLKLVGLAFCENVSI